MARAFRSQDHQRALLITFERPVQKTDEMVISLIRDKTVWLLPATFIGDNTFLIENNQFTFEEIINQSGNTLFLGFSKDGILDPDSIEILFFHNSYFVNYFDLARNAARQAAHKRQYLYKNVAIFTQVTDDTTLLQTWQRYYTTLVPPDSLYVLDYGQALPENALLPDVNIIQVPQNRGDERHIVHFCSTFQRFLLSMYRIVVHVDINECLLHASGTEQFLQKLAKEEDRRIIRPAHAYDLLHDHTEEAEIDLSQPISLQRRHVIPNEYNKKPIVTSTYATWGLGFHSVLEQSAVREEPDLYLIQLADIDVGLATARPRSETALPEPDAIDSDIISRRKEHFTARLKDPRLTTIPTWMRGMF
jgi:hypothetical protein